MSALTFNNDWMKLYTVSMGKVLEVKAIAETLAEESTPRTKQGLLTVGVLPNGMSLLADPHTNALPSSTVKSLCTEDRPYFNLYVRSGKAYFQVAYVNESAKQINGFCEQRSDVGLICTDNKDRHYLASLAAVNQ